MSAVKALSENTTITLSLAITIGGGVWWLSSVNTDVQSMKREISEMKSEQKASLQLLATMSQNIAVIKTQVELMQKPVTNTADNVRSIKSSFQQYAAVTSDCRGGINHGLFTMNTLNRGDE